MYVLFLLLVAGFSPVFAQTLTFSCATGDQTSQCNALNANAVSCQDDDACILCYNQCTLVPTPPPAGTECANISCIQGLCGGYALYQNVSEYNISCNDVYSDEYCEYCGACLGQFGENNASGNGTDSGGLDSVCDSDYVHLFCRLLPYGFLECGSAYGFNACMKCTSLDNNEDDIQQLCPALALDDATPEQLDLFCASMDICEGLARGPDCVNTDQEFDCKYCDYIDENMDKGLCVTEAPPIDCNSQNALACRLINGYNLTCEQQLYHPDTCLGCDQFSGCDAISIGAIEANQTEILCNGGLASNCSSVLFSSNCTFEFSAQVCDYCKLTNPICLYMNSNGSMTECNFSSNAILSCLINVTYFPCRAFYDSDYCSDCETVLNMCNADAGSGFPAELCDNNDFIRTCSVIASLPAEECNQNISSFQCEICQAVNKTCPPVNGTALDYLCSNEVICLCRAIISPDGICFEYASENECNFCKASAYFCSSGIDSSYYCLFNKSHCEGVYDSLTEDGYCNSSYSSLQCAYCFSITDGNGNEASNDSESSVGSGSYQCLAEVSLFCSGILLNSSCNIVYGEDCSFCENYLADCSEILTNQSLCFSSYYMLACSNIPLGPACDRVEHGFLCNFCTNFVENCTSEICSDEALVASCQDILTKGSTPSFEYEALDSLKCLPCSMVFRLCPNIIIITSSTFTVSIAQSASSRFLSSYRVTTSMMPEVSSLSSDHMTSFYTIGTSTSSNIVGINSTYSVLPTTSISSFKLDTTSSTPNIVFTSSAPSSTAVNYTSLSMTTAATSTVTAAATSFTSATTTTGSSIIASSPVVASSSTISANSAMTTTTVTESSIHTTSVASTPSTSSTSTTPSTHTRPSETPTLPVSQFYIIICFTLFLAQQYKNITGAK